MKLGDFMAESSASRCETIARDQKYKQEGGPSAWYGRAHMAIRAALVQSSDPMAHLEQWATRLKQIPPDSTWQVKDTRLCLETISRFRKFLASFDRKGLTFSLMQGDARTIPLEGVHVSVRPLARIVRTSRTGAITVGALLDVHRKSRRVSDRAGAVAAELVRWALSAAGEKAIDPKLCIVVDVFRGTTFSAPNSNKNLRKDIEATCRAIAAMWPTLKLKGAETEVEVGRAILADIPTRVSEAPRTAR